jgi:hypothetical protein
MERISKGLQISDSVSIFHQFLKYLSYGPTVIQKIMIILRVLQELRQKAHTELARLQPWDEWRLRGKTYCSLNLIPIQCVYEPNI